MSATKIYPKTIDLNQDNIPDSWEKQYFPNSLGFDTFKVEGFSDPDGPLSSAGNADITYREKFAAVDTARCQFESQKAESYTKTIGGGTTIANAVSNTNDFSTDNGNEASFLYHDPADIVNGPIGVPGLGNQQFHESSTSITIWGKTNQVAEGFKMFLYYTIDGSTPNGSSGLPSGTTRVAEMNWRHNQSGSGLGSWWSTSAILKNSLSFSNGFLFKYKIGIYRTGQSSCGILKNVLFNNPTTNSIKGFDVWFNESILQSTHVVFGTGSSFFRIYTLTGSTQSFSDVAYPAWDAKFYDNGNKIITTDYLNKKIRFFNLNRSPISEINLDTITSFSNLPPTSNRLPEDIYINKLKNKAYIVLPASSHIFCVDLNTNIIVQSVRITNMPSAGISKLAFDSEAQPNRIYFTDATTSQRNNFFSLDLNSSGLFANSEASLNISATTRSVGKNYISTNLVCVGSEIYYIDFENTLNSYNVNTNTNTVLNDIKVEPSSRFDTFFATDAEKNYLYLYSPKSNKQLQKINLTGPSKNKIPKFWINDTKFPNTSIIQPIHKKDGLFLAGFSNSNSVIQYKECITHNSPNAIYFKIPKYQLGSLSDEISYYYQSGSFTDAKGPNFIKCASGKCSLFLAPKKLSNTTYDPLTSPNEAVVFLESFGSYFPSDLPTTSSALGNLTVNSSVPSSTTLVGPVSNPAPKPWNREAWQYEQSQISYPKIGTVNPIFTSGINHYIANSDTDTFTNYDEFVYGVVPTAGASKPNISYTINPTNVVYFVQTAINRRYLIQTGSATNPNWSTTLTITGDGFLKEVTGVKPTANNFEVRTIADIIYPPAVAKEPGTFISPDYAALSGNVRTAIISGINLETVKSVKIDNTDVKNFEAVSDTRLEINFPDINTSGKKSLHITNRSGTTIFPNCVTYYVPPKINGTSQNKFPLAGGSVFVSGSGLHLLYARINNESNLDISSVTTTGFNAIIPSQSSTGAKNLSVTALGGKTDTTIEFFASPTINSVARKFNSTQGNTSPRAITTRGSNFVSGHTKLFLQRPQAQNYQEITPIQVVDTTTIESPVPASFVTGYAKIKVETFNGAYSTILNDAIAYINEPVLTSLIPSTGRLIGGQGVIFSGQNFNPELKAFIDYKPITNQIFVSDKIISGITPVGTSTGFKDASISGIFSDTADSFSFISTRSGEYRYAEPPVINTIGRLAGDHCIRTGTPTNILISGRGFLASPRTKVTIGGINANIISHIAETGITVSVPLSWNPGYSILKVNTEAGSNEDSNSYQWKLSYIGRPSISTIRPSFSAATGTNDITLYGTNFGTTGTMVTIGSSTFFNQCPPVLKIDGINTAINYFDSTELKFNAPALATAGQKTIELSNVAGTGTANIMYLMRPVVQSITPNNGTPQGGNSITISGSGILTPLYGATDIYFDNSKVQILSSVGTVNSNSRVVVVAPARTNLNKTTVDIKITNAGGETIIPNGYQYTQPMTIASSTEAGPLAGGNIFIASGENIPGGTIVRFGNNQATNINIISTTGIRATVPASSNIGVSTVLISGAGQAGITRSYAYIGQPIVTDITPSVGPADYNNVNLTISGRRFTLPNSNINYSSNLTIGGQNVLINSIDEKSINATITGTMTTGAKNVVFSNIGGTGTLINGYTGITYMPTYAMPTFVGSKTILSTSSTVNTLYVSYEP